MSWTVPLEKGLVILIPDKDIITLTNTKVCKAHLEKIA